jgi:hypothetical protein
MIDVVMTDSELAAIEKIWNSDAHLSKMDDNMKTFLKWCDQLGDRAALIKEMLDKFDDRLMLAPASSRIEFHNAFPGGFVDHSLRVLKYAVDMASVFKVKVPKESIIISALFHDLGKLGTLDEEYYLNQPSDWHRKRGQFFINNHNIKMANAQLGLFMLNQHNIKLSEEEYMTILLNDGQYIEANRQYAQKEPRLALIVHFADRWSCQCERGRASLLDGDIPKF